MPIPEKLFIPEDRHRFIWPNPPVIKWGGTCRTIERISIRSGGGGNSDVAIGKVVAVDVADRDDPRLHRP